MTPATAYRNGSGSALSELDDERLAVLAQNGDTSAFGVLVKRYERPLFNYLRRMTGSSAEAEDLFQETFLKAYAHLDGFRPEQAFRPWIYRIATNTCRDWNRWWRRLKRSGGSVPSHMRFSCNTQPEWANEDPIETTASPLANPRDRAIEAEFAVRLSDSVAKLSAGHRAVFLMARYEGMTYEQIGQTLGIPVGTVKSRMNKAVNTLVADLGELLR